VNLLHCNTHCNTHALSFGFTTHLETPIVKRIYISKCVALQHTLQHTRSINWIYHSSGNHNYQTSILVNVLHCNTHCNTHALSTDFAAHLETRIVKRACNATNSLMQHTATHCNTLHHTATRCNTLPELLNEYVSKFVALQYTLQHTHYINWFHHSSANPKLSNESILSNVLHCNSHCNTQTLHYQSSLGNVGSNTLQHMLQHATNHTLHRTLQHTKTGNRHVLSSCTILFSKNRVVRMYCLFKQSIFPSFSGPWLIPLYLV